MQALQKIGIAVAVMLVLGVLLPADPFQPLIQSLGLSLPLAYLAWFFPVHSCFLALTAWTLAIAAYYLYAWVMRQLDIIQ